MSNKGLAQSALNTAMMVAFAVPGGAPVGILAAVGGFLLGLFYPQTKSAPPGPPPLTAADLNHALASLKSGIINSEWLKEVDKIANDLPGLNTGLLDMWESMKARKIDPGKVVMVASDGTDDTKFAADADDYFKMSKAEGPGGMLSVLRGYRNTLTMSSLNDSDLTPAQRLRKRTQHTGLYCLVASVTVTYLKAALAWHWGRQLVTEAQWKKYKDDLANYEEEVSKDESYGVRNDKPSAAQYPGVNTDPSYKPPTWNEWLQKDSNFSPAKMLTREVQSILNECVTIPASDDTPEQDGIYTALRKNWDDFETQMASFDVPVSGGSVTADQMSSAIRKAMKRAPVRKKLLEQNQFDGLTDDDVNLFEENIKAWRMAAASASFTVYTAAKGDTPETIAKAKYENDKIKDAKALGLGTWLMQVNRDVVADSNALEPGTVLKIYPFAQKEWAPIPEEAKHEDAQA